MDLVRPIGKKIADILKEVRRVHLTQMTYTHPEEPVHHIAEAGHRRSLQVLSHYH